MWRKIRSSIHVQPKTWGQNMGLLGPKPCASGGKGNGLNGTFGRGGGDRTNIPYQRLGAYGRTAPAKFFTRHPRSQRKECGKINCLRDDRNMLIGLMSRKCHAERGK